PTTSHSGRSLRGLDHSMPGRREMVPDSASGRPGNLTTVLPSRIAQQFHGAPVQRERIESGAGAFSQASSGPASRKCGIDNNRRVAVAYNGCGDGRTTELKHQEKIGES